MNGVPMCVLDIVFFKSGTGYRAMCRCGHRFPVASGCNRAGMLAAREIAEEVE